MPFLIQGSTASIVPYRQVWQDTMYGVSHDSAPIVGAFKNCQLDFDICTYAQYQQWSQYCNTGTSLVTLTIMNLDNGGSFTAFSGIFLTLQGRPEFVSGYVGPFSILVSRCLL